MTFTRIRSSGGFTLMQLIFIIALVGALAIFAAVNVWNSINTYRLHSAMATLLSDMRYAQHLARTHNGWYGIRFQAAPTNTYVVYSTDGSTDTAVQRPQNQSQQLVVNVSSEFGGVTISAVNIAGGIQVEFDPQGIPYDDRNGAPIATNGAVTISSSGSQKVINIIKNTGRVETQ